MVVVAVVLTVCVVGTLSVGGTEQALYVSHAIRSSPDGCMVGWLSPSYTDKHTKDPEGLQGLESMAQWLASDGASWGSSPTVCPAFLHCPAVMVGRLGQ